MLDLLPEFNVPMDLYEDVYLFVDEKKVLDVKFSVLQLCML